MERNADIYTALVTILKRVILFVVPAILLINWGYSFVYRAQYALMMAKIETTQHEELSISEFFINNIVKSVYDDLHVIRNSSEFNGYLRVPSAQTRDEMIRMFYRIALSKDSFRQIRYIDTEGMEVARVNYDDEIEIVPDGELQDKSDRYYVVSLIDVPEDTLYISDLDLNIENGEYSIPYQPIVRFGLPVYQSGERMGSLIINYDGWELLSILNKYNDTGASGLQLGLLDKSHLLSLDGVTRSATFLESFLNPLDQEDPFSRELFSQIESSVDDSFMVDDHRYRFKLLDDLPVPFVYDAIGGRWILLSSFDIREQIEANGSLIVRQPFIRYLFLIGAAIVLVFIVVLLYLKENDRLLLLASGYISEYTHDGVLITDRRKRVIYCNKVFEDTFGYRLEQIKGRRPDSFLNGGSRLQFDASDGSEYYWEGNVWDVTSTNTYVLKYLRVKAVRGSRKTPAYFIGIYSEAKSTMDVRATDSAGLLVQSFPDKQVLDFINPVFEEQFTRSHKNAVIVLKIFDYSTLKTWMSDSEESKFVNLVSQEIRAIVEARGVVAAPSSGLLILTVPCDNADLLLNDFMVRIDAAIAAVRFSGQSGLVLDYLSGIAISPDHGTTSETLIHNAFIALEALTKLKRSKYLVYDHDIYENVRRDRIIRNEIETALSNHQFSVEYQLQKSTVDQRTTGVEALVRWENPRLGAVSPSLFIPIMEESRQIKRLGKHVLDIVLSEFESVDPFLPDDFKISINLSSQEFTDKGTVSELIRAIQASTFKKNRFCFEITETTAVENVDHTNELTSYIRESGITVAIDDFGTGYSSLSYLKNIQSDKLKIDRIFIRDYPEYDDGKLIKAIVGLAQEIDIHVVVEGVETQEQLEYITSLGCEEYQGYLSSRPMPMEELQEVLEIRTRA